MRNSPETAVVGDVPITGAGRQQRQPGFLYIGAPRAGSTWIHQALRQHPDIFVPVAKEIKFFDYNYHRGWDWYLRHFLTAGAAAAVGEVCHDYYLSEAAARRIRDMLPDVRLICCLREPGDCAMSVARWLHRHTRRYGSTFAEIADHHHFAHVLDYRKNLQPYFDLFAGDRLLIVFYEDLRADPRNFVRHLYEFVGVDPDFVPAIVRERSNRARAPRSRLLLGCAFAAAQVLRRMGATNLIGAIKQNRAFERLVYDAAAGNEDASEKAELERIARRVRREMADDLPALAELIGRELPADWLRAAADAG